MSTPTKVRDNPYRTKMVFSLATLILLAAYTSAVWSQAPGGATVFPASATTSAAAQLARRHTRQPVLRARQAEPPTALYATLEDIARNTSDVTTLSMVTFDAAPILLQGLRVKKNPDGSLSFGGTPTVDPLGSARFVMSNQKLAGYVEVARKRYEYVWDVGEAGLVYEVGQGIADVEDDAPVVATSVLTMPATAPATEVSDAPALKTVDVLIVYEDAVLSQPGASTEASIAIKAQLAIDEANEAYENSGVRQRLALAGVRRTTYLASGNLGDDLGRLQATNDHHGDEIHQFRDALGADVVVLLIAETSKCGRANLAVISSAADDDSAFAVVKWSCMLSNLTLPHEIGHIGGAYHDRRTDKYVAALPYYAHGYWSEEGKWYTIMGYQDRCGADCIRIKRFSNPDLEFGGRKTGSGTANNARRLNETAGTLAAFRIRGPRVGLYEGNDQSQDHVCVVSVQDNTSVKFTDANPRHCDNDEARSFVLYSIPKGRVLRFFDSPDGSTSDDWVEIIAKRDIQQKMLRSFETDLDDADITMTFHRNDGLDGKVSRLVVAATSIGPRIDLYEANSGTQNLLCSLPAGGASLAATLTAGTPVCDNDEARSLVLYDVPPSTIRLYDSGAGFGSDDWTEIVVKRMQHVQRVDSFEHTYEDANLKVTYHRNDGLDGKVSKITLTRLRSGPVVDLYEGNNASQNLVCSLNLTQGLSVDLVTNTVCNSDEARSLVVHDLEVGTILRLYDNRRANREDDWVEIQPLVRLDREVIGSLETSYSNGRVRVTYFRNNSLDGKVSRLEVRSADDIAGVVSFYEGRNGTQNKLCDRNLHDRTIKFGGACDNDEAKSLVLTNARAGTVLRVYDDGDCRSRDDWTRIEVLADVSRYTVRTFEADHADALVNVDFHRRNGLDGKVSCVTVTVP